MAINRAGSMSFCRGITRQSNAYPKASVGPKETSHELVAPVKVAIDMA